METANLESLLQATQQIVIQHEEERKAKGEDFNIFSVLGMDTNETKTHSNMLTALLNPYGDHYQGDVFLRLFLEQIGYEWEEKDSLKSTTVETEFHLGKISKDYLSGGFIDLLITLPNGKYLKIENKIHAGDQKNQMYRYSLFTPDQSTLYYLNLFGDKPDKKKSLHTLTDNDYEIINYRSHIISWLEKCLEVVELGSIIHTSIKQYLLLIKKLTNTMGDKLDQKLEGLIIDNLEQAKFIHSHYQKSVEKIRKVFRKKILEALKLKLEKGYNITLGSKISSTNSQIWIKNNKWPEVQYGIESFSGLGHNKGRLFVGIIDKDREIDASRPGDYRLNNYWPIVSDIKTLSNNHLNLSSSKTLGKIYKNEDDYTDKMIEHVASQIESFVITYK